MLPKKELNIYPKTEENFKALISFYFDKYELDFKESREYLLEKTSFSLNQIEFIFRKLSEAYEPIFSKELKGKVQLATLLKYGFNTLTKKQEDWNISKSGVEISKKFLKFVQETEINIGFLEKNN